MSQQPDDRSTEDGTDLASFTPPHRSRQTFLVELVGLMTLASVLGYVAYQSWEPPPPRTPTAKKEPPTTTAPKSPSPQLSPDVAVSQPNIPASTPSPLQSSTPDGVAPSTATGADRDIYQRLPRTGLYYALNSQFSTSRREISHTNDRLCIKIIDGPPAPSSGYQRILVSSLSVRRDGVYVDATADQVTIDSTYTELTDGKGAWQWFGSKVEQSGLMAECLGSAKSYVRQAKGEFIQGN